MLPFRRILLTGARGFVGTRLAPALIGAAPATERVALLRAPCDGVAGFSTVLWDISDVPAMDAVMASLRPDLIIHLAAQSSVASAEASIIGSAETWRVNVGGTLALAAAVARHAPNATVLFTSSSEVYGAAFRDGPVDENTLPRPRNAYGRSKHAAEHVLQDVLPTGVRLVIARACNHVGPGQDERFALSSFAAQIARIEAGLAPPRLLVGNLDSYRDFLHVDDVVAAYLALIAQADALPQRAIVNVASGMTHRIGDLLNRLLARTGMRIELAQDPSRLRLSDIPHAAAEPRLLQAWTGWAPQRGLDQCLDDILASARKRLRSGGPGGQETSIGGSRV